MTRSRQQRNSWLTATLVMVAIGCLIVALDILNGSDGDVVPGPLRALAIAVVMVLTIICLMMAIIRKRQYEARSGVAAGPLLEQSKLNLTGPYRQGPYGQRFEMARPRLAPPQAEFADPAARTNPHERTA